MRKSFAAIAVALALAVIGGCKRTSAGMNADPGPTISRNYQVSNFQQIEIAGPYDVVVRTGANPGVSAKGPQKRLDNAAVEVQGDKLVIHPREHQTVLTIGAHTEENTVFTVTVPQLRAVSMAGSGDMEVDSVRGDQFEATLTGEGGLRIGSVDVHGLKISMSGSGDTKLDSGRAQTASYQVVGEGGVDAPGVVTQQLKVNIAGTGDVKAHATGTADISIVGEGDVAVAGGAKCTVTKAGTGDAKCS